MFRCGDYERGSLPQTRKATFMRPDSKVLVAQYPVGQLEGGRDNRLPIQAAVKRHGPIGQIGEINRQTSQQREHLLVTS